MPQFLAFILSTGAINAIYGNIAASLLLILFYPAIKGSKIAIGGVYGMPLWLLFSFGFTYVIFGAFTLQGIEFYMLSPLLAYLSGWTIGSVNRNHLESSTRSFVMFIIAGYSVHAALNLSINVGRARWDLIDFFSESGRAATGSGTINTLAFSLIAYFLVVEKKKKIKLIGIFFFSISLVYAFVLGSRTQFLIMGVVAVVVIVVYFHEQYTWAWLPRFIVCATGITITCIAIYQKNLWGIQDAIESSNLFARNLESLAQQQADSYRMTSVLRGLLLTFEYPFGGLEQTNYYHNMWLDAGRVAGLIPFLLLLSYSLISVFHIIRIFCNKSAPVSFRYMLLCLYIGVLANFFVEPVLEGIIDFFLMFCRINGLVDCYYYMNLGMSSDVKTCVEENYANR